MSAKQEYAKKTKMIEDQIAQLEALLTIETTTTPDWGHVGTLGHLSDILAEAIVSLQEETE